jgi:bidirectional [NiFe] hydrogenase diaphorase subunit
MTPQGTGNEGLHGTDDDARWAALNREMARRRYSGGALIEILHFAQQLYGYLPHPLMKRIAHALQLPPSRVLGVATFYHLFRLEPPKAHAAIVCMGTACYAAGAAALMRGIAGVYGRSAEWTVRTGRCVGSCGLAPVVICDGAAISRVSSPAALERAQSRNPGETE